MLIKKIYAIVLALCLAFFVVSPLVAGLAETGSKIDNLKDSKLDNALKHDIENRLISGNESEEIKRIMIVMNKGEEFDKSAFNQKIGIVKRITSYLGLSPTVEFDSNVGPISVIEYDLSDPEILIEIANSPEVDYIMEEPVLYPQRMDGIQIINSDIANTMVVHGENLTGKDQSICLIDSGVDYTHPDLAGHLILGRDTAAEDDDPMDESGHGTGMAGIIQVTAPEAKIVVVRACDPSCGGLDMVEGVQWCIDHKDEYNISAISMSISDMQNHPGNSPCPTWMDTVLQDAINSGMFVISGSGNQRFTTGIGHPACSPYSAAAGASTDSDTMWIDTNTYTTLDLLAPGESIISTNLGGGYFSSSGTSNAAPFIAGAAVILQQNLKLRGLTYNPSDILELLKNTGVMIGSWPRIDVEAAINGVSCYENTDCGTDVYSAAYCSAEGNSVRDLTTYTCANPGTLASSCSSSTAQKISEICDIGCDAGTCIECSTESDCNGGDDWTGSAYCSFNDIYQIYMDATCSNPGTAASSCSYSDSLQLKQSCAGECINGKCDNIECTANSDCGTDTWLDGQYCSSGTEVSKKYRAFTCNLPGTTSSYCSHTDTAQVIDTCSSTCSLGLCLNIECYSNRDCGKDTWDGAATCQSGDVWQTRTEQECIYPGTTSAYCSADTTNKKRTDCDFGCENGVCLDNIPTQTNQYVCSANSDCGANGLVGSPTCQAGNVWQTNRVYTCNNPATFLSYCSQSNTPQLKESCSGDCLNGACIANSCNAASDCGTDGWVEQPYCNGNNVYQIQRTWSCTVPGTDSCSFADISQLKESCTDSCSAGICVNENGTGTGTEDIEVRNFLLQNPASVTAGNPAKIIFSVRNNGAATITEVEWELDNGVIAERGVITNILAGETKIVYRDVTFPSAKSYYASIELDPEWKINEFNEDNNRKEAVWTIS